MDLSLQGWFWLENKITENHWKNSWNHLHPLQWGHLWLVLTISCNFGIFCSHENSWNQLNNCKTSSLIIETVQLLDVRWVWWVMAFNATFNKISVISWWFRGGQFYWWREPKYQKKTKKLTNCITLCSIEYTPPCARFKLTI